MSHLCPVEFPIICQNGAWWLFTWLPRHPFSSFCPTSPTLHWSELWWGSIRHGPRCFHSKLSFQVTVWPGLLLGFLGSLAHTLTALIFASGDPTFPFQPPLFLITSELSDNSKSSSWKPRVPPYLLFSNLLLFGICFTSNFQVWPLWAQILFPLPALLPPSTHSQLPRHCFSWTLKSKMWPGRVVHTCNPS
jgi:hypothetical protein